MNAVNEHKKFGMAIEKWRVLMLAERQEFVEDEIDCAEREKPDEIGKGFLKPDAFDQKKDDGKLHDVGASVGCKK